MSAWKKRDLVSTSFGMQINAKTSPRPAWVKSLKKLLWATDLSETSISKRLLIQIARIATQIAKDIWNGQLTLRAMSLVYTTLLSLVPLLAISFSVLKGFGVHREIEPFLITFLAPLGSKAEEIALRFVEFIDNTSVSALGYIGFAMLFYAVISLMQKIERAFNFVWRIEKSRSFPERIRDYLTLIIVGPTLMFAATGLWATIMGTNLMTSAADLAPLGWILSTSTRALPIILVIIAFTFVYAFVPNTHVKWQAALIGGIVSGLLWNAGGVGFALFVGNSANYPTIYSGFATAVFFMIWLYLAWMFLLIGSSISFYIQNPYSAGRQYEVLSIRMREKLALAIAASIGRHFYHAKPPHTVASIAEELSLPSTAVDPVLAAMVAGDLLVRVDAPDEAYVPAQSWDSVPISRLMLSIRSHGEDADQTSFIGTDKHLSALWDRFEHDLNQSIDDLTLKDLSVNATTD
jgi:membrane protein